jgi:hypothetical protein
MPTKLDSFPMLGESKKGESRDIKISETFVTLVIRMNKKADEFDKDVFLDSLRFAMGEKEVYFLGKPDDISKDSEDSVEVKTVSSSISALRLLQTNDKLKDGKGKGNIIQKLKDTFNITSIESPDLPTFEKSELYKKFEERQKTKTKNPQEELIPV